VDGLLLSPQDWRSGWNTGPDYVYYGNPVDRRAHGDVPFLEWYLKQFAAAERKAAAGLLDFLDITATSHQTMCSSSRQATPRTRCSDSNRCAPSGTAPISIPP
jgi:hypothetical protein